MAFPIAVRKSMSAGRGAETGGILGVNTPAFFTIHPPLFRPHQKIFHFQWPIIRI